MSDIYFIDTDFDNFILDDIILKHKSDILRESDDYGHRPSDYSKDKKTPYTNEWCAGR